MKVIGNLSPQPIQLEFNFANKNDERLVKVWLRENIVEKEVEDKQGNKTTLFEYDEYTMKVEYYDGLQHDIEEHLDEWLNTGRIVEFNENASEVQEMKEALRVLGVEVD